MPGAYRYSATFDRTYEEDLPPPVEKSQGRSQQSPSRRSLSTNGIHQRSASTDSLDSTCGSSGSSSSHSRQVSIDNPEYITTRVVKKATAKPAHNPLQFVKVASCPLSRKAEQLAKKKPEPKIKDEEEEWQSNLDNWKSRRRKQSEGALQRLEEIRRFELEEQQKQQDQKKTRTKTFSEMMEERAQRPKQYNLRISGRRASESVLRLGCDFENGSFEKPDSNDNSSCDRDSSDSTLCDSTVEEAICSERSRNDSLEPRNEPKLSELPQQHHSIDGNNHSCYSRIDKHLSGINENELEHELGKEKLLSGGGYMYTDSGLDSLSSSHKTGDIADSASDFSQDSGSSLDSDFNHTTGPLTTGVELLEEFSSRVQSFSENVMPNYEQKGGNGLELFLRIWLKQGSENKDFGFVLKGRNESNIPIVDSVIPGGVGDQAGLRKNDQILAINGECTQDIKHEALCFVVQQASYTGHLDLVIWRAFSNIGSNAQGSLLDSTSKSVSSDVQQKRSVQTVEKQNSLVSDRKSSFEGELKQKEVIQRTNKDIKPAADFKEKVSSFERRSSAEESPTLVSKSVPTKSRPPVPAKPSQLQLNGEVDSTSPSSKSKDNKLLSHHKKVTGVDLKESKVNNTDVATISKTDLDVASKSATNDLPSDSKSDFCVKDAQHCTKDDAKRSNLNNGYQTNKLTENSPANRKTEVPKQNHERHQPQRLINLQPVGNESGLNIIYESHPEQTTAKKVKPSSAKAEVKSKPKLVSQKCIDEIDSKQISSTQSSSDQRDSSVCDKSSDDTKGEKGSEDKTKKQNHSQQGFMKQNDDVNSNIYNIPLGLSQDEILLAELDLSSRKIEPPKEKPPPPPPDESDVEKPDVIRANRTKEIKRELWKRRSDFLGIEFESGPIEVDESKLPCPPQIEEILKSERELEREKRQILEQQRLLRKLAEEEEIARKEKEIIENIEREERERQQALEMEAALVKERESAKQIEDMDHSVNKNVEISGIHQSRSRKKEKYSEKSPLQQLNSVNRLKNELPLQESERYKRHQQGTGSGKASEQPVNSNKETMQSETNSETQSSSYNNISDTKSDEKEISTSSTNKTPTKKMIMRQERERMRREQEALQRQDGHILQKHHQHVMGQASKQGVHQNIVPDRVPHEQSSIQVSGNPRDREDIIYASRHPEAMPTDVRPENVENETVNQEVHIQSQPLSKHSLHSLGAAPKAKAMTNEQWVKPNEKQVARRRMDAGVDSGYNQYHWLVQEAEMRRISEQKERQYQNSIEGRPPPPTLPPRGNVNGNVPRNQYYVTPKHPPTHCALPYGYPFGHDALQRNSAPGKSSGHSADKAATPNKPPRSSSREQLLSVSGRKRCSHCGNELGRGAAMIIESLQLFYHIQCFCCCVCQAQLGNGSCGTDVRVRNNKLHCQHCYSNDEAGLKFSQV